MSQCFVCLFVCLLISGGRSQRERKILLKSISLPSLLLLPPKIKKNKQLALASFSGNEARLAHKTISNYIITKQRWSWYNHDQSTLHTFVAPGDDKNTGLQLPQHHLSLTTIYDLALMVPLSLELHALRSCL